MATALKNLSDYNFEDIPEAQGLKIGIVISEWNSEITFALLEGATKTLSLHGASKEDIDVHTVPGSFELPLGAQFLLEAGDYDAIICIGCVIKGETKHFDFICEAVSKGITDLGLKYNTAVVFGVLTTDNEKQAKDRAGGVHGNKGDEAAITAIKMARLKSLINNG